jgi:hypothetical protein
VVPTSVARSTVGGLTVQAYCAGPAMVRVDRKVPAVSRSALARAVLALAVLAVSTYVVLTRS